MYNKHYHTRNAEDMSPLPFEMTSFVHITFWKHKTCAKKIACNNLQMRLNEFWCAIMQFFPQS